MASRTQKEPTVESCALLEPERPGVPQARVVMSQFCLTPPLFSVSPYLVLERLALVCVFPEGSN